MRTPALAAAVLAVAAFTTLPRAAHAETTLYYGVCQSYAGVGGDVVIRTTKNSTGTWKVDGTTKIEGPVQVNDWVAATVETSGHVVNLRSEEHAAPHTGVVKAVKGIVLSIASGNSTENWNVTPETGFVGVDRGAVKVGDEIGFKPYKNHNLAEISFIKSTLK